MLHYFKILYQTAAAVFVVYIKLAEGSCCQHFIVLGFVLVLIEDKANFESQSFAEALVLLLNLLDIRLGDLTQEEVPHFVPQLCLVRGLKVHVGIIICLQLAVDCIFVLQFDLLQELKVVVSMVNKHLNVAHIVILLHVLY